MIIIASIAKVPLMLANLIIKLVSGLTSWWIQTIAIVAIILCLILASIFSKQWETLVKKWKENRKKMKQEIDIEMAKIKSNAAYETTKNLGDALGSAFDD